MGTMCIHYMYMYIHGMQNITLQTHTQQSHRLHSPSLLFLASTSHCLVYSASPLHFFQLFMTVNVWQYIIQTTNNYARLRFSSMPPTRRSIFRNWKDITLVEMQVFIGFIIQMGLAQLSDIKDYWSTHVTLNFPFFRSVFSRDRFLNFACRRNTKSKQAE